MKSERKRVRGTLNDFYWEDRVDPPTGRCILLYHKGLDFYVGTLHIGLRSRSLNLSRERHYVSIYISPDISSEFIVHDLDVAKLKAEVEAKRLLDLAEDKDVEFCRLGKKHNDE